MLYSFCLATWSWSKIDKFDKDSLLENENDKAHSVRKREWNRECKSLVLFEHTVCPTIITVIKMAILTGCLENQKINLAK